MLLLKVSDVPGPETLVFYSIQCKEQLNLMLLQLADGEQLRSAFHGFNPVDIFFAWSELQVLAILTHSGSTIA